MDAKVTWQGKMAFTGMGEEGISIPMDAHPAVGGEGKGVLPMELILLGLGGCTAMDVISILAKKRQEVTGFEINLHADRAEEHPKVFTDITIEYVVTGKNIDEESVIRAIELSETKYCPGMGMLRKAVNITNSYKIIEA